MKFKLIILILLKDYFLIKKNILSVSSEKCDLNKLNLGYLENEE